jgi:uncharacterized protein YkwD
MRLTADPRSLRSAFLLSAAGACLVLAGCMGGVQQTSGGLAPGLSAQVNTPGAQMDASAALSIVNHYRSVRGVSQVQADPALNSAAATLARQYASTGTPPSKPGNVSVMRLSAGYENFAETFSGWRNSPADADAMASAGVSRAGFAAVYDPNSAYGTHWVMVLAQ